MKLLFKQRFFSWFDSYDIYDEAGNTVFVVKGELAWGHLLRIYDAGGNEVGYIKEKVFTWLPKFEMYIEGNYAGCISKEFTFFKRYITHRKLCKKIINLIRRNSLEEFTHHG